MPARDRTGPLGQGPRTGRGLGRARGAGQGPRGLGGSEECECPKCGHVMPHNRGIPCTEVKCPKCGILMRGKFCK